MYINESFAQLASHDAITRAVEALKQNGISAVVVENGAEAKKKFFELLPEGAEVMNNTSRTLETLGIVDEILKSGKYNAVRNRFATMDPKTQHKEMNALGAAPEYSVGSVHAVTENGCVLIASNTGSQLGSYANAALHVIWIVGAQKIVKNMEEGMKRLYEYALPLEDQRAREAYGRGSNVSKILVVSKEVTPDRIHMIIVKEKLGF